MPGQKSIYETFLGTLNVLYVSRKLFKIIFYIFQEDCRLNFFVRIHYLKSQCQVLQ
jgi:hypothetical protein